MYKLLINRCFICLLAISIILNHSVYYFAVGIRKYIQLAVFGVIFCWLFVNGNYVPLIKKKNFILLLFYLILNIICLLGIADDSKIFGYIFRYFLVVPVLLSIYGKDIRKGYELLYTFSSIMILLSICSLVLWGLGSVAGVITPNFKLVTSWGETLEENIKGGYGYLGLYFEIQRERGWMAKYITWRNCGIFCEAPAYALFLLVALTVELFFREEKQKQKIIILIVTILTTTSSLGLFYLILLAGEYLWLNNLSTIKKKNKLLPFGMLILAFLFWAVLLIKSNQTSITTRFRDYRIGLSFFMKKPILGYGLGASEIKNVGFTSSIIGTMVSGGIVFTWLYFMPIAKSIITFFKRKKRTLNKMDREQVVFAIMTLYVYVFTNTYMDFIMLFMISFLYSLWYTNLQVNKINRTHEKVSAL